MKELVKPTKQFLETEHQTAVEGYCDLGPCLPVTCSLYVCLPVSGDEEGGDVLF